MGIEIERKFLVKGDAWRSEKTFHIVQGYLTGVAGATIRIRIMQYPAHAPHEGYLAIKGPTQQASRLEFEYSIPPEDAQALLGAFCTEHRIEKERHYMACNDHLWEIDEFLGSNAGLVVAEIELSHVEETFTRPAWLGDEVTHDPRYYNANLATHPFSAWQEAPQP